MEFKQYSKVKYLGWMLDETMFEETMALSVINKINNKLKFIYQKKKTNRFLTLRQLLCNALIQPHFDCACSAWYPNNLWAEPCILIWWTTFNCYQKQSFCIRNYFLGVMQTLILSECIYPCNKIFHPHSSKI